MAEVLPGSLCSMVRQDRVADLSNDRLSRLRTHLHPSFTPAFHLRIIEVPNERLRPGPSMVCAGTGHLAPG